MMQNHGWAFFCSYKFRYVMTTILNRLLECRGGIGTGGGHDVRHTAISFTNVSVAGKNQEGCGG